MASSSTSRTEAITLVSTSAAFGYPRARCLIGVSLPQRPLYPSIQKKYAPAECWRSNFFALPGRMARRVLEDLDHSFCAMVAENVLTGSGCNTLSFLRRGQQSLQLFDRRIDRTSDSPQLQSLDDTIGIYLQ